jgi:hypothetical protein
MPPLEDYQAEVLKHGSQRAAAHALGINESTIRYHLKKMADKVLPDLPILLGLPTQGFVVKKNSVTYDSEGEVKSQSIATVAGPGEKFEALPGHTVKGESVLLDPDGRVLAKWVKTREGALGLGLIEALESSFERFSGAAPLVQPPAHTLAAIHTIYPLADLHLGMYSWGRETGEAYDIDIALERARAAYRSLIAVAPASKTATLLNLGDYFHANDAKFVTPASGHQLDVDGRHPRVLEAGADLLLELVDLLLQKHEEVEIVCLPGNHDPDAMAALRVALRIYYRRHDRVTVDNSPGVAWYKRFGKNLIGATHGHTIKQGELPGMMACDRAQDWGLTEYRSYFTAHIHHERAVEKSGVRVESFQTLASRDAYATNGGWRSGHSVQAITFHDAQGEVSRSRVNVLAQIHKNEGATS